MRSVSRNSSAVRTYFSSCLFFLIAIGGPMVSFSAMAAIPVENVACILGDPAIPGSKWPNSPNGLNCTANDTTLSTPVIATVKPCNFPGDIATVNVTVDITIGAQTRYDLAVWLAVDGDPNGDGAETGVCSVLTVPNNLLHVDGLTSTFGDGDSCGDVFNVDPIPADPLITEHLSQADLGTVDILCLDSDGDGVINVPIIVAWEQQSNNNCAVSTDAVPGTASKCVQNLDAVIDVPIPGRIIVNKDTIPDDAQSFSFTLVGPELNPIPAGGFDSPHVFPLADTEQFDSATFNGGLTPGVYDLQETPHVDYESSMLCTSDLDGAVGDPTAMDLSAGETITCNVTNTLKGQLAIVKRTFGNPIATFDFTLDDTSDGVGTNLIPFDITTADDGNGDGLGSRNFSLGASGEFIISEIDQAGWDLSGLSCDAGSPVLGPGANDVTITVVAGDTVTCTFENTEMGVIIVDKVTNPTGAAQLFDFVTNYGAGSFQLADATTPINSGLLLASSEAGDYSVVEQPASGWEETSAICSGDIGGSKNAAALDLLPGETINCTFTNTKQVEVTLQKEWTGGVVDDTSVLLAADTRGGTAGATSTATGVDGVDVTDEAVLTTVIGETVTLGEVLGVSNVGDYTTTFACNGTNDPTYVDGERTATLVIDGNDGPITCTFTNTIQLTQLQLAKTWSGAVVGDAITAATTDLTNDASLASTSTGDNTEAGTAVQVFSGETATLGAESFTTGNAANYTTSDWVCDDAAVSTVAPGGTLDITDADLGNTITCTVTNTIVQTQLQLAKTWSGAVVGDAITATTTGLTNNPLLASTTTGDDTDTGPAAQVFVGESAVLAAEVFTIGDAANYTASSWVCDDAAVSTIVPGGSLAIAAADAGNTITCTVTNTIVQTQLQLAKSWSGAIVGDAITATTTGLTNNPLLASTTTGDDTDTGPAAQVFVGESAVLAAEVFTIGDAANYTASSWVCDDAAVSTIVPGGSLAIAAADAGNTITCTVTNTRIEPIINLAKTVNGDATDEGNGTYTVEYTITASNSGGWGTYDVVDEFSPGDGITFIDATAVYMAGTENDQSGVTGLYPIFVTDEGLAGGLNESWIVTASFIVDPAALDPATSACDPGAPVINTGFYNAVSGSATDVNPDDNDTCTGLPEPGINLAKVVDGDAVLELDGTYTVVYTITATNTGGPGVYDLVDTFSPGDGITLNTAVAVYLEGTENDQSGTTDVYPNFVADEGLAGGLDESWTVTANFTVDPAALDPATSSCDPLTPVINTGFYNFVEGSDTDQDTSDNDACTGLIDPTINLAKVVDGDAVLELDGTYTVVYTITATNTGGPGVYDLVDTFSPGTGITLDSATAVYLAGSEDDQSGTTGVYPNFVTDEGLGEGMDESWTVTASFTVDPATLDPATSACDPNTPVINTGFYNLVEGSATDVDPSDNDACTGLPEPGINLAKTVNGPAVRLPGGTYEVEYTITATNTGGPGVYSLIDAFTPGVGITLDVATAVYMAGTEDDQSGTTGDYPNFVTDEGLADGMDESWIVTATFNIDLTSVTAEGNDCDEGNAGGENTGFTNGVTGSDTDVDDTDNKACTEFIPPVITLVKSSDVPTYAAVGDEIIYSYLLTNVGPDILDPGLATVADDKETVTCPVAAPVPVGGTVTCTATHVVIQADLDAGTLVNLATGMIDDVTSNEDTVTVTAENIVPPVVEAIPVPVNDKLALLLLTLMMLATGWYFKPAVVRKR